jgi:hypothetical protein
MGTRQMISPVTIAGYDPSEYETVAASATAQVLGATGATGDYLEGRPAYPGHDLARSGLDPRRINQHHDLHGWRNQRRGPQALLRQAWHDLCQWALEGNDWNKHFSDRHREVLLMSKMPNSFQEDAAQGQVQSHAWQEACRQRPSLQGHSQCHG